MFGGGGVVSEFGQDAGNIKFIAQNEERLTYTFGSRPNRKFFNFTVSPCIFYIDLICTNVYTCMY